MVAFQQTIVIGLGLLVVQSNNVARCGPDTTSVSESATENNFVSRDDVPYRHVYNP